VTVLLARDEGPVRWLMLNRPDRRNALSAELVTRLREALAAPGDARCIALTGAGKVFSAGADLEALQRAQSASPAENLADARLLADLFADIAAHPLPVIAALNGHALGGGAGLAVACDFTLAVADAKLGFTEVRLGFVPAIVLNFLLRAASEKVARDLCLTGRLLDAPEAEALGLLRVADDLPGTVAALGREIAAASPAAVRRTKELILELRQLPLTAGLQRGAEANAEARGTPDCREGIAAFLEKRRPRWGQALP